MKKLSDLIIRKKPKKNGFCTFEEYCDINGINKDNISERDINFYYNFRYVYVPDCVGDNYEERLYETLTSHSKESLVKRLTDLLNEFIIDVDIDGAKNIDKGIFAFLISKDCPIFAEDDKEFLSSFELSDCELSDKIYDIFEFYKYYITFIEENEKGYILAIESYFTEDARETIKENGNILYHITESLNVPDILKKGLRPKTGKRKYQGGYRYFPERVYLIGNNPNIVENIDSVIRDKEFEKNRIQYTILKIDLGKHNISLWYDDASDGKYNVYTLEAIPPSLISITTLDDMQKSIRNARQSEIGSALL